MTSKATSTPPIGVGHALGLMKLALYAATRAVQSGLGTSLM